MSVDSLAPSKDKKRIIHGREFIYHDEDHHYTADGVPVPGVTTILRVINKPNLFGWYVKVTRNYWLEQVEKGRTDFKAIHKESWNANKNISKAAQDIGTNVHAYAEAAIKGMPLPELLTDGAKLGAEAFHKWMGAHKVEFLASERLCFSEQFFYGGTCDLIAKIDGETIVGDFKTSTGIYNESRFQTAAYQQALQEEKGMKFDARWVIRFDKETGQFEAKRFENFDLDFGGFSAALSLHRALQEVERGA